jgi:hypothetical protein
MEATMTKLLAAALVALSTAAAAPAAASAATMPVSTSVCTALTARPRTIGLSVDGSGFIAGYRSGPHSWSTRDTGALRWTTWNANEGRAWGGLWLDDGVPNIAQGTMQVYHVNVHVYRPQDGMFTRMVVTTRRNVRYGGKRVTFQATQSAGCRSWTKG